VGVLLLVDVEELVEAEEVEVVLVLRVTPVRMEAELEVVDIVDDNSTPVSILAAEVVLRVVADVVVDVVVLLRLRS